MTKFFLDLKLQFYKIFFGSLPEFWSFPVYHLVNRDQRFNSRNESVVAYKENITTYV